MSSVTTPNTKAIINYKTNHLLIKITGYIKIIKFNIMPFKDEKGKKKPRDRKLIYKPEIKEAFEQLKSALLSEPVLIIYNPNKLLKIKTNLLNFAIGGVLEASIRLRSIPTTVTSYTSLKLKSSLHTKLAILRYY
ncbi:hypothetical protein MKX08_009569 [Trichoderma sp. CBMAI-0020]|nr:hypothetical protein MKX08_009569 [Trichoderma sp. CBMAI-0020]